MIFDYRDIDGFLHYHLDNITLRERERARAANNTTVQFTSKRSVDLPCVRVYYCVPYMYMSGPGQRYSGCYLRI